MQHAPVLSLTSKPFLGRFGGSTPSGPLNNLSVLQEAKDSSHFQQPGAPLKNELPEKKDKTGRSRGFLMRFSSFFCGLFWGLGGI